MVGASSPPTFRRRNNVFLGGMFAFTKAYFHETQVYIDNIIVWAKRRQKHMDNHCIRVIFPMAGDGTRFGGCFKPFLRATELTFIEHAKMSFDPLKLFFSVQYVFVYRHDQEVKHDVELTLRKMFPADNIICYFLDNKRTEGPLQTVNLAIQGLGLQGPAFVCDCDHCLDIEPMIQKMLLCSADVIIPTWCFRAQDHAEWGKVCINKADNHAIAFCEKEQMIATESATVHGMIGAYFFRDVSKLVLAHEPLAHFSDLFKKVNGTWSIECVEVKKAGFFGNPKALETFRFNRAKANTLFVDLDGTLIRDDNGMPILESIQRLCEWKAKGHTIVITTGRSDQDEVIGVLKRNDVPYDHVLCGLPPGPRGIINDKKPYLPFYRMAWGADILRNHGFGQVCLPLVPEIRERLKGASFAATYIVTEGSQTFVRKHIHKTDAMKVHVDQLKRQCADLKLFSFMGGSQTIVPAVLREFDSDTEYFYDMEYLDGFDLLAKQNKDTVQSILCNIVRDLHEKVYCYRGLVPDRKAWMVKYVQAVMCKSQHMDVPDDIKSLLLGTQPITINGCLVNGLSQTLENLCTVPNIAPMYLSHVHGDLTLENILVNTCGDYRLIDNAGSAYLDARELDVGKLFQSTVCDYMHWPDYSTDVRHVALDEYELPHALTIHDVEHVRPWLSLYVNEGDDNLDWAFCRGVIFMCVFFVRMTPFMYHKRGKEICLLNILLSRYHAHKISCSIEKLTNGQDIL